MNLANPKGFLNDEVPTFEEFSENALPSLDYQLIIDGISSLPLYQRLNVTKELFSEEEIKSVNSQAEKYSASYYQSIASIIPDNLKEETNKDTTRTVDDDYSEEEGDIDTFLKYFFNCSENDEIIERVKQNADNTILTNYTNKADSFDDDQKLSVPPNEIKISKEFSDFIYKTNEGIYDNIFNDGTLSSEDSGGSSEERDEMEINRAKALSRKLEFRKSASSKTLEEIFEIKEPPQIVNKEYTNKASLKVQDMFQSESESETEMKKNKQTKSSAKSSSVPSGSTKNITNKKPENSLNKSVSDNTKSMPTNKPDINVNRKKKKRKPMKRLEL